VTATAGRPGATASSGVDDGAAGIDPRDPELRLATFFDDGSLELITPRDDSGMLAGRGTVGGTPAVAFASDATIQLAKQHGTWFDMDIYNDDYILATGTANGTEQESLDKERMIGLKQRQTFQRAVRAGVKMIFGTDAGVYPHGDNAKQFAKMVQWGMTAIQAIRAATTSASEALGRSDVGAIEPGRYGDIIAVRGDPLQNVTVLEHVDAVIKGGKLMKGPGQAQ